MSRQQHIHDHLCSEVNEVTIAIKLHHDHETIMRQSTELQNKIIAAQSNHKEPTWEQMIDLLTRVRDEMSNCTKPFIQFATMKNTKEFALALADAQFIGFYHGKQQSLIEMVQSMGLTASEWEAWKRDHTTTYLTASEIAEINEYFLNQ